MTDRQKIKHTIKVLMELEARIDRRGIDGPPGIIAALYGNMQSLRHLLEKPHTPDTREPVEVTNTWEDAMRAASRLFSLIRGRKPNFKEPDSVAWNREMDKIIRIDRRTPAQLMEVIDWSQQHSFWQNNILSPAKLRKQLDTLELQMSNDYHWQKNKLKRRVQDGPTVKEKYMEELNAKNREHDGRGDRVD